ncbi:HNH endonuclease [Gordonia sp. DT101]|uniref:HNH endonuclease n=1 Tax=Gordonia sp. DT101 TaxID=3416545 RepID=UPI003CE9637C
MSAKRRALLAGATIHTVTPAGLRARWDYYEGRCWVCGDLAEHMDHVRPLSRGGSHCLANLRPACAACNLTKGSTWPLAAVAAKHHRFAHLAPTA